MFVTSAPRVLPVAPNLYTNGAPSGRLSPVSPITNRQSPGLSQDPRLRYQHTNESPIPSTASSQTYNPAPNNDYYLLGGSGDSIYSSNQPTANRQPSRPRGAAPPFNGVYDDVMHNGSASPGSVDVNRGTSLLRPRTSDQYRPVDAVVRSYSPTHSTPLSSATTNTYVSKPLMEPWNNDRIYRSPSKSQLPSPPPPPPIISPPSDDPYC